MLYYSNVLVCAAKLDSKFDQNLASQVKDWIQSVIGEEMISWNEPDGIKESLKDGVLLCKYVSHYTLSLQKSICTCRLINEIKPDSVKKINTSKMAFKMVSNKID